MTLFNQLSLAQLYGKKSSKISQLIEIIQIWLSFIILNNPKTPYSMKCIKL